MTQTSTSAGGAGALGGSEFQENIACYFAALILSETMAEPHLGLPQTTSFVEIVAESAQPVDDLNVTTSGRGMIFIQAKKKPSLSDASDGGFAAAVDQFVRQFIAGVQLPGEPRRALDWSRDRLALAVGERAPSTVTTGLRSALDKLRTIPTWAQLMARPETLNKDEQNALSTIRRTVKQAWLKHSASPLGEAGELGMLHGIYILPLDFTTDGHSLIRARDLLRTIVLSDSARAGDAWRGLLDICRSFGPRRTGGGLEYLRQQLVERDIPLASTPGYRKDIESLKSYTKNRIPFITRLSELQLGGKLLKIPRPVVSALYDFASHGSCVVVGEPGAGKSGCLHDLVAALRGKHDVVLLTADTVSASTATELARDLQLTAPHTLVDVLTNWSGDRLGYLVVDALDAARAGMSLHVLCEVLREVSERAPRWRIVASIREYDLRTSKAVQELFEGSPHAQHRNPRFKTVRHVSIEPLTTSELAELGKQSGVLAASLDAASASLKRLLRNPFNVNLLCKLLDHSVGQTELNAVRTQGELLDLYWSKRVEHSDAHANATDRRTLLADVVRLMIGERELHVSRVDVEKAIRTPGILDVVLGDGLLIDVSSSESGTDKLGFAHNILFDYATHRLWLNGMHDRVVAELSASDNHDLLLAIRPSIVMSFESLWYLSPDHASFWNRAFAVETSTNMHLMGKIIAPTVAAQAFVTASDLEPLLAQLGKNPASTELLRYLVQAAITHFEADANRSPLIGEKAPEWMALAERLSSNLSVAAWDVRSLLLAAKRNKATFTSNQASQANKAAIALVDFGLRNQNHLRVVRPAIETVASTILADVPASAMALRQVLTPQAAARGGHEWLHPVAAQLGVVAEADAQLALDIVDAAFKAKGTRDEQVPMGGRILDLRMNRHDLLAAARHDIVKAFPTILNKSPVLGARILVRVIANTIEDEHPEVLKDTGTVRFGFMGGEAQLKPDASYIWSVGKHNQNDDWWKILTASKHGLVSLAAAGREAEVAAFLRLLRDENTFAVVWAALLDAAAQSPATLGPLVAELLASADVLGEADTRKAAGDAIAKAFGYLSIVQRSAIEAAILAVPEEPQLEELATYRRDRVLGCIPPDLISSPKLKQIREALDAQGGPPANVPDFSSSASWGTPDKNWFLRERAVDPKKHSNSELLRVSELLRAIPGPHGSPALTEALAAQQLPLLQAAEQAIRAAPALGADGPLAQQVDDELVDACEKLASAAGLKRTHAVAQFIRSKLREAATSARPKYDESVDAQWDTGNTGWGSPLPRIDAAMGLMRLASSPDLVDDEVLDDLERLSMDKVAAVRFQVLASAPMLYHTAPRLMMSCIEHVCLKEQRAGIVDHACSTSILRMWSSDGQQLEPLVRGLFRRSRRLPQFDDARRACAQFYMLRDLWHDDKRGRRLVTAMANAPSTFPDETNRMIDLCRELFTFKGDGKEPKSPEVVRQWAVTFLTTVTTNVRREAAALRQKYASATFDDWPNEELHRYRLLHHIAHNVATEVHIGLGASGIDPSVDDSSRSVVATLGAKQALVTSCAPLFDALCQVAFVEAAYDVLQTLEFFVEADPLRVLLWVATVVRQAEADSIQYESMAADLVVQILKQYLSEYGPMFRADKDARRALLDVLAVFVKAGWPGAVELTFRIGEVYR